MTDASKNFVSGPIGSTVEVQQEDGRLWTYGTIEEKGDENHHEIIPYSHHKIGRLVT